MTTEQENLNGINADFADLQKEFKILQSKYEYLRNLILKTVSAQGTENASNQSSDDSRLDDNDSETSSVELDDDLEPVKTYQQDTRSTTTSDQATSVLTICGSSSATSSEHLLKVDITKMSEEILGKILDENFRLKQNLEDVMTRLQKVIKKLEDVMHQWTEDNKTGKDAIRRLHQDVLRLNEMNQQLSENVVDQQEQIRKLKDDNRLLNETLKVERSDRMKAVSKLKEAVHQLEKQNDKIAQQEEVIARQEDKFKQQEKVIASQEDKVKQQEEVIARQEYKIKQHEKDIARQEEMIKALRACNNQPREPQLFALPQQLPPRMAAGSDRPMVDTTRMSLSRLVLADGAAEETDKSDSTTGTQGESVKSTSVNEKAAAPEEKEARPSAASDVSKTEIFDETKDASQEDRQVDGKPSKD